MVPGARQEAKAHADRHRKLMQALAADVAAARPASAAELVEFVRDADARLAVVVADEAAVVAQFPAFPKVLNLNPSIDPHPSMMKCSSVLRFNAYCMF